MGDDVDAPHSYVFHLSSDANCLDAFDHLAENRYLASVGGRDHSWEAIIDMKVVAVFRGNNTRPEPSASLHGRIPRYHNPLVIWFRYNSSAT